MAFGISAGTAALIGGGLAVGGALIASDASRSASHTAADAANNATNTQLGMFNTVNAQQQPWRDAGQNALSALVGNADTTLGLPQGYLTRRFDASDLNSNLAPNYQFMLDQGLGAIKNAGNVQTGLMSGNTLKGINDYAQNYAGNAYQQAFTNYNTNQSNIFNRLATIAGFGSGANQVTANAGTTLAGNAGNSQIAAGQASAAGTIGSANAINGGLNNALGWYSLPQMMNYGQGQQLSQQFGAGNVYGSGGGGVVPTSFDPNIE